MLISTLRDVVFIKDVYSSPKKQFAMQSLTLHMLARGSCLLSPEHWRLFTPIPMYHKSPDFSLFTACTARLCADSQATTHTGAKNSSRFTRNVKYNLLIPFDDQVMTLHQQWGGPNGPFINTSVTLSTRMLFSDYLSSYP